MRARTWNSRERITPRAPTMMRACETLCLACGALAERSLCGSQPRDRDAIRRARHVVEADLMAERDGRRITAVLAADTNLESRSGLAASRGADLHEFADPIPGGRKERGHT